MRLKQIILTSLCLLVSASLAMANEKKQEKRMDPQAMMEMYKKLGTPGEPHKQLTSLLASSLRKLKTTSSRSP
jgi:hypothetical protein